jgi:hypothetical protein
LVKKRFTLKRFSEEETLFKQNSKESQSPAKNGTPQDDDRGGDCMKMIILKTKVSAGRFIEYIVGQKCVQKKQRMKKKNEKR